jgi:FkbM family methyltransferase
MLGYYPAKVADVDFRCHPDDWRFWRKIKRGRWEPFTFHILSKFLNPESVYFDVGSWIGPTVLYAAQICKEVYCFEPDPYAYERLLANLRLNKVKNVKAFHSAIFNKDGVVKIGHPDGLGVSESSILRAEINNAVEVSCTTFETIVKLLDIEKINMIKIDIEGAEFDLIPSAREFLTSYMPTLYLSTHAPLLPQESRVRKMKYILEALSCYSHYYDCNLRKIEPGIIMTDEYLSGFSEFIVSAEKLV